MRKSVLLFVALLTFATLVSAQVFDTQNVTAVSTGACADTGACATFSPPNNAPSMGIQVSGPFVGTLTFEATTNGRDWVAVEVTNLASGVAATTTTAAGIFTVSNQGIVGVRARATAWTSGTAIVTAARGTSGSSGGSAELTGDITVTDVGITSIAAGDNNIGNVDVASSALPTGAATAANQTTANASLSSIDGKITAVNTGAVVVSSSALPTGAATSAAQTTAQTSLSSLVTNTTSIATAAHQVTTHGYVDGIEALIGTTNTELGNLTNTIGSTTSGQSGILGLAAVTTSAPSYTTAQSAPLSVDTAGALRVAGAVSCSNCSGSGASTADNAAWTFGTTSGAGAMFVVDETSTNSVTENSVGAARMSALRIPYANVRFADIAASTGAGAVGTGVQRTTLASDDPAVVALQVLDNAISGTGVNVSQLNGVAVTMGNGASGTGVQRVTLASDSTGVLASIGAISTSVTPGTAAGNLGKAEDAVAASGDTGVAMLALREDTPSATAASGDYIVPKADSVGRLYVNCASGCSGTSFADNAAFTFGTTTVQPLAGVFDDTSSNTATENSAAVMRITANKALHVNLRTAAGAEITPGTDYTQDAALTVSTTAGPVSMGRASAAAPTNVSADNDAVMAWMLQSGATVTQTTFGGVLASAGAGAVGTGVQRTTLASDDPAVVALQVIDNAISGSGVNVSQINGVAVTMGNGAAGTGVQRVTLASDSTGNIATIGTSVTPGTAAANLGKAEDAAHTSADTGVAALAVRRDAPAAGSGTTGDYETLNTNASGALWTSHIDPCSSEAKITAPFSLTARGVIIAAAASKKNYICGIVVVAGAAEIFNLVEGTGTTCQTSTAAIVGSTTAANGLSFAINGGMSVNAGNSTVIAGTGTNVDTCIMPSSTGRLAGFVTYVQR